MRFIKAMIEFFKPFIQLALRRRRLLRPSRRADAGVLLGRFLDRGVPPDVMAKAIAKHSQKDMRRQVKRAYKKGKAITVEDLIKPIKADEGFLVACANVGLSINFFKGLAENAIKEGKKPK